MLVSINRLAEITGLDRRTIKNKLSGVLPETDHGETTLVDTRQALPVVLGTGERLDPAQEKAQLDRVRREIAELERARIEGSLTEVSIVNRALTDIGTSLREALLAIPGRVASPLAAETDARQIEHRLTTEIRDALLMICETDISAHLTH